jgi:site-specific recombinase XerD
MKATFRLGLIDSDSLARTIYIKRIRGERTAKGRSIDAPEITRLIAACDSTKALGVRNAAIVAIGFGCGLRRAELVGLNVADVLEHGEALRILGKGNKERIVYVPDGAQAYLATWLGHRGYHEGPLFCAVGRRGIRLRSLTEQTIYDVLRALTQRAGIERLSPHDLRRAFVSTLLDQNVSLSVIALMAGHAEIATTARYDRRGERAKREASRMLVFVGPAQN